ncbi:ABC transporter ATP-binding protein [Martelella alba]|uniref:ABC transporter ATP-binding protein n=1 Tax=Martelella alba TaxID=2590451 RepID=A0A506UFV9_9HYPH|nr:ABC transporter ATP-binding protein [Martelella alba]TPW30767.1 ABC transporter ATP-binding protein [Martelella alba]
MPALELRDIAVSFEGLATPVLAIDRLEIAAGEHVAISGPSGSGKSTFVNIVTGLERLKGGQAIWGETDLATLSESRRDRWRGENIGLVMQDFHLFSGLSALENVLLPARLCHRLTPALRDRAAALLSDVGLTRVRQQVETMSRGEMQRVAIARALLREPAILVADEPTASLDAEAGAAVAGLLLQLAARRETTLIVVSHDERLLEPMQRRLRFRTGRIVADEWRP